MRIASASVASILGVIILSQPSLAATISVIKGQALLNRGAGFQKVEGNVQANPGDSVMVSPEGSSQIVYGDGCSVPVNPGRVITVTAESPCRAYGQVNQTSDNDGLYAIGVGAIVIGTSVGLASGLSHGNGGTVFKAASP